MKNSMKFVLISLLLLLAACSGRSRSSYSEEEEILRRYSARYEGTNSSDDSVLAQVSQPHRFHLLVYKKNVLEDANILVTLEQERRTERRIESLRQDLERTKTASRHISAGQRDSILRTLDLESARLAMIRSHKKGAGLPPDKKREMETWKAGALTYADRVSLEQMKRTAARKILYIENQLKELKTHPRDLVWDQILQHSLRLRFEAIKLASIEKRLGQR